MASVTNNSTSSKRWRFQYGIRTLLVLMALSAVGFGVWRYWEVTRERRMLAAAIRNQKSLSEEEKDLYCALVWQKKVEPLKEGPSLWGRTKNTITVPRLHWNGDFVNARGQKRRVFVLCKMRRVDSIIVTDDKYRLIQWADARCKQGFLSAKLLDVAGTSELEVEVGPLTGPFHQFVPSWETHRYRLAEGGIEKLSIAIQEESEDNWKSTRKQRAIVAAIREYEFWSDVEKELFCALVWQKEAEPLLEKLRVESQLSQSEKKRAHRVLFNHERCHLTWETSYSDKDGRKLRLFGLFKIVGYIVLTDHQYRLLDWTEAKSHHDSLASIHHVNGKPQLALVSARPPSIGSFQVIYRYSLEGNEIEKLPSDLIQLSVPQLPASQRR